MRKVVRLRVQNGLFGTQQMAYMHNVGSFLACTWLLCREFVLYVQVVVVV